MSFSHLCKLMVCGRIFSSCLYYIIIAILLPIIDFRIDIIFLLFTNPSARAGYDTRSIFRRSLTGLNSEFSFSYTSCLTKAEEPSLSYYLPIAGGRIIVFIPFARVLVLCEMQSVSSRIWTRIAVFISYDDNDYTTGTSNWHNILMALFCASIKRDSVYLLKCPLSAMSRFFRV